VNYVFDGWRIVLHTPHFSRLAAKLPAAIIALEVDEVELCARGGWSVLATGLCHAVTDQDRLDEIGRQPRATWMPGTHQTVFEILSPQLSGRRIVAPEQSAHHATEGGHRVCV
jgi:hypothetical protein